MSKINSKWTCVELLGFQS